MERGATLSLLLSHTSSLPINKILNFGLGLIDIFLAYNELIEHGMMVFHRSLLENILVVHQVLNEAIDLRRCSRLRSKLSK